MGILSTHWSLVFSVNVILIRITIRGTADFGLRELEAWMLLCPCFYTCCSPINRSNPKVCTSTVGQLIIPIQVCSSKLDHRFIIVFLMQRNPCPILLHHLASSFVLWIDCFQFGLSPFLVYRPAKMNL